MKTQVETEKLASTLERIARTGGLSLLACDVEMAACRLRDQEDRITALVRAVANTEQAMVRGTADLSDQIDRLTKERDEAWYTDERTNNLCRLKDAAVAELRNQVARCDALTTRLAAIQTAVDDTLDRKRRANYACPAETCAAWIVSPLTDFATQPERDADPLSESELLAELALLYNHKEDDSRQFTRWQMLVAIRHGMALAARGLEVRKVGAAKA